MERLFSFIGKVPYPPSSLFIKGTACIAGLWNGSLLFHSALDSLTQHCPTIGQLDTQLTNHWTVGHSADQLLDSWRQHCSIPGQLSITLTSHWTVGHSTDQSLDCLTQHFPTICSNSCPTIGQLDIFCVFTKLKLFDGRQFVQ